VCVSPYKGKRIQCVFENWTVLHIWKTIKLCHNSSTLQEIEINNLNLAKCDLFLKLMLAKTDTTSTFSASSNHNCHKLQKRKGSVSKQFDRSVFNLNDRAKNFHKLNNMEISIIVLAGR